MTMTTHRIGPRMLDAVRYVARNRGCAILPVADHVGPNGSRQFGYRTVHRAIRAGLITARKVSAGWQYSLEPTVAGLRAIGEEP